MRRQQFLSQFSLATMGESEDPLARHPQANLFQPASVLLAMEERDDGLNLLLTRRSPHLRHHANQISFPGGKQDDTDLNLWHTATREAWEEVGLPPEHLHRIGQLPDFHTISRFRMQPQLAFIEQPFAPKLSLDEVSECFYVPLGHLLDPNNRESMVVSRRGGEHRVYFMFYQNYKIWGATAAVIEQLVRHLGYPAAK